MRSLNGSLPCMQAYHWLREGMTALYSDTPVSNSKRRMVIVNVRAEFGDKQDIKTGLSYILHSPCTSAILKIQRNASLGNRVQLRKKSSCHVRRNFVGYTFIKLCQVLSNIASKSATMVCRCCQDSNFTKNPL